jgi:uroporphyrinogen-III synthase
LADSGKSSLAGKRIVVTRAAEQSGELQRMLEQRGAEVLLFPLVRFAPPEDSSQLDEALRRVHSFDVIVFLSANAVRFFCARARDLGLAFAKKDDIPRIAAVGPATSQALAAAGISVDYIPSQPSAEALAREFGQSLSGRSILLPRSDLGDDAIVAALAQIGAQVAEVIAYRTRMPEKHDPAIRDRIRSQQIDVVVFASPSSVRNFIAILGADQPAKISGHVRFAAIGPRTAEMMRKLNLLVSIEAAESSTAGLVTAIERFFWGPA